MVLFRKSYPASDLAKLKIKLRGVINVTILPGGIDFM